MASVFIGLPLSTQLFTQLFSQLFCQLFCQARQSALGQAQRSDGLALGRKRGIGGMPW